MLMTMTRWTFALVLLLLVTFPLGCGKKTVREKIDIPKGAAVMQIDFSWDGIEACEHHSPEIKVAGIPAGTVKFKVRLEDVNRPAWNHGGGEAANDGSGIIPAGALTVGYNGPCPPPEKRHKYEFLVLAVDDADQTIGFGKARQLFPPRD